jgi:hypothetical protein
MHRLSRTSRSASTCNVISTFFVRMHPLVGRNLPLLGQLDHADWRLVAARAAGPASERRLQLPDRRVTRPADSIQRQARPCLASTALDLQPAIAAVQALANRWARLRWPAALAGMCRGRPAGAQSAKPNIVFILADDLGYADVSCYGQRDYTTPNVDRLAAEGLKFTQAYSNSPDCSSTRTGLITGRYQARLPLGLEEPLSPASPKGIGLAPSHPTLPSLLKKVGYGATLVGKWHLGDLPEFSPLKSGYDQFFGILGCCADYFNHGAEASRAYVLPFPRLAHQLYEQEVPGVTVT